MSIITRAFIKQNLELFKKMMGLQPTTTKLVMDSLESGLITVQELNRLYIFNDDRINQLITSKKNISQFLPFNFTPQSDYNITGKILDTPYNLSQFFQNDMTHVKPFDFNYEIFSLKTNIGYIEESKPYYLNIDNVRTDYINNVITGAKQVLGIGGNKQVQNVNIDISSPGQKQVNTIKIYGEVTKGNPHRGEVLAVHHVERVQFNGATLPANAGDPEQFILVDGKTVVFTKGDTLTQVIQKVKDTLDLFVDIYSSIVIVGNTINVTYLNYGPKEFLDIEDTVGSGITYTHTTTTLGVEYSPEIQASQYTIDIGGVPITIQNGDTAEDIIDNIAQQTIPFIDQKTKVNASTITLRSNTIGKHEILVQISESNTGIQITNEVTTEGYDSNILIQQCVINISPIGLSVTIPAFVGVTNIHERVQYVLQSNQSYSTYFDGSNIIIESAQEGIVAPLVFTVIPSTQITVNSVVSTVGTNPSNIQTVFPSLDTNIKQLFVDSLLPDTDPNCLKNIFMEFYKQAFMNFEIFDIIDTDDAYKIQVSTNQNVQLFSLYITQLTNLQKEQYPDVFTVQNVVNKLQLDLGTSNWFTNNQIDSEVEAISPDMFRFFPLTQILILEMVVNLAVQHYSDITINNPLISDKQSRYNDYLVNIEVLKELIFKFNSMIDIINLSTYKYMKVFKL